MTPPARPPRLSFAIPLYDAQEAVPELLARVVALLDATTGGPHEMIVVDDGSSDRTAELLRGAVAEDLRLVVVELSRNFGHQAAVSAGRAHATGDVVFVMDGDLQDCPEELPAFSSSMQSATTSCTPAVSGGRRSGGSGPATSSLTEWSAPCP